MATKLTADEIVQYQHVRGFLQFGEPGAENEVEYYGKSAQYFFVEGLSAPETGSINAVNMPDPLRRRRYRLVGREVTAPDLPQYNLILHEKHGRVPRALGKIGCEFNLFLSVGRCKDPTDFDRGWEDYLHVLEGGIVSDKDHGTRTSMADDTPVSSTLTVTLADEYAIGPIAFGPQAATNVTGEAIDATYGVPEGCQGCDDGKGRKYVLVGPQTASPAASPKVTYKIDDGAWTDVAITGIGAAVVVDAIALVGPYLVVLVSGEDAYYYTEVNDLTGVPSSTWTKVTTGIVAAGTPRDMYVASPAEVFLCGDGGYIYRITDVTAGAEVVDAGNATSQDLKRIKGVDEVVVAVGANGAIIKSVDAGVTFATTTSNGSITDTIQALDVVTALRFWIGTDAGEVWWTKTGGEDWTEKNLGITLDAVQDIVFPTRSAGFIAATTATPEARVFATQNGGRTWVRGKARLPNLSALINDRYNRIAVPFSDSSQTNANNVILVGLAGDGVDGVVLTGEAAEL